MCLPSGEQRYAGQTATVIGWGSLKENGPQPDKLQVSQPGPTALPARLLRCS